MNETLRPVIIRIFFLPLYSNMFFFFFKSLVYSRPMRVRNYDVEIKMEISKMKEYIHVQLRARKKETRLAIYTPDDGVMRGRSPRARNE